MMARHTGQQFLSWGVIVMECSPKGKPPKSITTGLSHYLTYFGAVGPIHCFDSLGGEVLPEVHFPYFGCVFLMIHYCLRCLVVFLKKEKWGINILIKYGKINNINKTLVPGSF